MQLWIDGRNTWYNDGNQAKPARYARGSRSLRSRVWLPSPLRLLRLASTFPIRLTHSAARSICGSSTFSFFTFSFLFFGAAPYGLPLGGRGARASPEASPCRSAVGAARSSGFRFFGRGLSSAAARARAVGLPSPLNAHRSWLRWGALAVCRTVPDALATLACPSLARPTAAARCYALTTNYGRCGRHQGHPRAPPTRRRGSPTQPP